MDLWSQFRQDAAECSARLIDELRAASQRLEELGAAEIERFEAAVAAPRPANASLEAVARLYGEHRAQLLTAPIEACGRDRPQTRTLAAFDNYDRAMERLVLRLPETTTCSGAEWMALVGGDGLSPLGRTWLRWRRTVPVRSLQLLGLRATQLARRRLEGRLLDAQAEMSLDLLMPWQAIRRAWFATIAGEWRIASVYLRGQQVDRAALRAKWNAAR